MTNTPPATIHLGDCIEVMRTLPENSVDAVITDPPYGLGFMGKAWDELPPGEEWARECLRVLKPGGHLLAFGGSRTWHRLAVAVEDAGFEVRDSIAWLYGQGFPKSLNVGKDARFCQCEKVGNLNGPSEPATEHGMRDVRDADVSQAEGTERGPRSVLLAAMSESGSPAAGRAELSTPSVRAGEPGMEGRRDAQEAEGELHGGAVRALPAGVPGDGSSGRLRHGAPAGDGSVARSLPAAVRSGEPQGPRPVEQRAGELGAVPVERGSQAGRGGPVCAGCGKPSAPAGLGTALKPSFEPIVVARKPLACGTVAANVLAHGTGALNIDGCRIAGSEDTARPQGKSIRGGQWSGDGGRSDLTTGGGSGRWPANVVLDESQAAALDEQSGERRDGVATNRRRSPDELASDAGWGFRKQTEDVGYGGGGGASRFFPVFKGDEDDALSVLEAAIDNATDTCRCGHGAGHCNTCAARAVMALVEPAATFKYQAKAPTSERPFYYRPTCECEDAWATTAPARATDETGTLGSLSTSNPGNDYTAGQSPTATTSTTSTVTSSTTTPLTSLQSPPPTTSASILDASCEGSTGSSRAASAASSSRLARPTGISAAKDGPSTGDAVPATLPEWSATSVCGVCGAPPRREGHATVKPLALMRWLVRLVTPPGGTVLEPFAGSGTTVEACALEGFACIAIEREPDYLPLIQARLARVEAAQPEPVGPSLFDMEETA